MSYPIRNNLGAFPTYGWEAEARIMDAVITAAFEKGYTISVFDGEEYALKRSKDRAAIQKECMATDQTNFVFRKEGEKRVGEMIFIHGNKAECIHDYSDNPETIAIWEAVKPLVEMLENNG